MIGSSLFRAQAVASRSQRERLDHLLKVTAPNERHFLTATGAIVVLLLGWLIFGTVTRTVFAEGMLVIGTRHAVVSETDGQLAAWYVAPGDRIEAGAPIARLAFPKLDARIDALHTSVNALENAGGKDGDNSARVLSLAAARLALLELEADRIVRETLVSPAAGEIVDLRAAPSQRIVAGDVIAAVRGAGPDRLEVLARITEGKSREVEPDMPATVTAILAEGVRHVLAARVVNVSPPPSQPEQTVPDRPAARFGQIRLAIDDGEELRLPEGTQVHVKVILERVSPAQLLGLVRS